MIKIERIENTAENKCMLCPRNCEVDRSKGETGFCGMTNDVYAARAALHMWEEPCISGMHGSGAVFFTGCQLKCVFCQNAQIAAGKAGKKISIQRLAEIFLELQEKNANNINLVSPTHYVLQITKALDLAKAQGLVIPVVYNTSAYENVETLKRLEGYVDIYLPDFKYVDSALAAKYSHAADYFKQASGAVAEMFRQCGSAEFFSETDYLVKQNRVEEEIMKKGLIVRHLVLPNHIRDSKKVIRYLYKTYGDEIYISIMNQYTPLPQVKTYPELNRTITDKEYEKVVGYALKMGVKKGFVQEEGTQKDSFIPEFNYEGI